MKKSFTILFYLFGVAAVFAQGPGFVAIKNNRFFDQQGNPFLIKGINYSIDLFDNDGGDLTTGVELRPHHGYNSNSQFNCTDATTCWSAISADFNYIKNTLGCNTIRVLISNGARPGACTANDYFLDQVFDNTTNFVHTVHTTDLTFIIPFYAQLCDVAANNNVNIILVLWGGGAECGQLNPTLQNIHDTYFAATASALSGKQALLAYDEWNEPQWDQSGFYPVKADVCNFSKSWYTLLKANDPNHLVTVGISASLDACRYSQDVYKADFYAFHFYPDKVLETHVQNVCCDANNSPYNILVVDKNDDYNNISDYNQRFDVAVKWLENTTTLPWILGETGFSSFSLANTNPADVHYYLKNDGDQAAQAAFLEHAYKATLYAGGQGTLWWQYKEVDWSIPNDPMEDGLGIVTQAGQMKPAAQVLASFDPYTISGAPTEYPADMNLLHYSGTTITGTVKESSGAAIKDAVITGYHSPPGQSGLNSYVVQTISDASGNFSLTSVTPDPQTGSDPLTTIINNLEIGAIGFNVAQNWSGGNVNGKNIILSKAAAYFNVQPNPAQYVASHHDPVVSATEELTLTNFKVDFIGSGAPVLHEFTAGKEIAILPQGTIESFVVPFAEAAFYIKEADADCADPVWGSITNQRVASHENNGGAHSNAVQLSNGTAHDKTVYLDRESFSLLMYPNPTAGRLLIESEKNITFISVSDMYGKEALQLHTEPSVRQTMNIGALAPGVYSVMLIYADNTASVTQIIKQ